MNTCHRAQLVCLYSSRQQLQERTRQLLVAAPAPPTKQASGMTPDAAFALEIAVVAALVVLVVAIVVASSGGCDCEQPAVGAGRAGAAVHDDVERALGSDTLVTYEQARAASGKGGGGTAGKSCAICLSDYAAGGDDELVRVLPACGHFFHAGCGIDGWLRAVGTCPVCRGEPWPLPRPPRPECAPMPPRASRATGDPPYRANQLLLPLFDS
ncbi:hypothetical protein SEVIR_9G153900v4 [Setaria viridis]|uniref:uncharacterized protein n=1 Tax=Setaria viridis TaxID=4556 RepID=UPI003B3BA46F